MASPESYNVRRLARSFTPNTPNHHPLLDPDFPKEDISLVPTPLAPRGQLNWELPKKAVANLHIMLKISNNADELLEEFHQTIPQIDEALHDWVEMKGASLTKIGEEQLRARSFVERHTTNEVCASSGRNDDYVFNMAKNLDNPGRADVIYLTEGVQDLDPTDTGSRPIADNIRGVEWLDFDGSYVHLQDTKTLTEPSTFVSGPPLICKPDGMKKDSTPQRSRTSSWCSDQARMLTPTTYRPESGAKIGGSLQHRPFDHFWLEHAAPNERPGSLKFS